MLTNDLPGMDDYESWACADCGDNPAPFSHPGVAKWRWDGERWQHHHAYPVGHVICVSDQGSQEGE